jgi:hypothetical protein
MDADVAALPLSKQHAVVVNVDGGSAIVHRLYFPSRIDGGGDGTAASVQPPVR